MIKRDDDHYGLVNLINITKANKCCRNVSSPGSVYDGMVLDFGKNSELKRHFTDASPKYISLFVVTKGKGPVIYVFRV